MKRINKWLYGYKLYVNYGQGWTYEQFDETRAQFRENRKAYRENCPYPQKWSRGRELNPEWETQQKRIAKFPGFLSPEDWEHTDKLVKAFFRTKRYADLHNTPMLSQCKNDRRACILKITTPVKFRNTRNPLKGVTVYYRTPEGDRIHNTYGELVFESSQKSGDTSRIYEITLSIKGYRKQFRKHRWDMRDEICTAKAYGCTPKEACRDFDRKCEEVIPRWLKELIVNTGGYYEERT
ncbi:hypothetical protein EOM86_09280 [Candidatus Nomurabacteria bacterium]|nr:hypothetical protein [Candidatus Nomurabacteria bacterium]